MSNEMAEHLTPIEFVSPDSLDIGRNASSLSTFNFSPGRNIWRLEKARRAAFLIDADEFYRAFAEAAASAQEQILILGWDTDSRAEIPLKEGSTTLGALLTSLVEIKPNLHVSVLTWDFAFIYLFERESLPSLKFSNLSSERIRYVLDHEHPNLASHHQKVVVIDDRIAFVGGLDITQRRWDTPEHRAFDERRVDPDGHAYGPFHDVQFCVEGDVAMALGELGRERWRRATGETLPRPALSSGWPLSRKPDLEHVSVAISRTLPFGYSVGNDGILSAPVAEIERLFIDLIAHAKDFVYIENQYFTSAKVARAIARRLAEESGPEFLLILPRDQTGWIEESTMGLLRSEALRIVESADVYKRFRSYHPIVPGLTQGYVKVHSKVMIVDDQIVRIGSANMNSRSLGLDTECDLTVDGSGDPLTISAVSRLRSDLMAEHLGVKPEQISEAFADTGTLRGVVDRFVGGERTLRELRSSVPPWVSLLAPPKDWIDPHAPRGVRRWVARRVYRARFSLAVLLVLGMFVALAFFSGFHGFSEAPALHVRSFSQATGQALNRAQASAESAAHFLTSISREPWAMPAVLCAFVLGTLTFIPVTILIFSTLVAFPNFTGVLLAVSGSLLSTAMLYAFGKYWAWSKSKFLKRGSVQAVAARLKGSGVWGLTLVRFFPIAPFGAIAVVAGGLRVSFRDFMISTLVGLLPGIATATLFAGGIAFGGAGRMGILLWVGSAVLIFTGACARKAYW